MKTFSVILAVVLVLFAGCLLSVGGCTPKARGFFGDKPVDRATFERQANQRRGKLEAEAARLAVELATAKKVGDAEGIAAVEAEIAAHEIERRTFNRLYGDGAAELDRQAEANEQVFTTLTAAGDYTAAAMGIPPGISQLGIGMLLAFAARAGWIRLKRPPQLPPNGRSPTPATPDPPVSA